MEKADASGKKPVFKINKGKKAAVVSRVTWGKEHDTCLVSLVEANKGRNWKKIASEMQSLFKDENLSAKKCRERWCNCTNPDLNKTSLTDTEELFLLAYHHTYKNKWALISQHLTNRNSSKLKNNFSSLIRKVCRKIALDEKETLVTLFYYVQSLYAALIIYDLAVSKDNPEEISAIAPVHIYEHVHEKSITGEKCQAYVHRMTLALTSHYKARPALQKLATLAQIDAMKDFLSKVIQGIKTKLNPTLPMNDEVLMNIVESALNDDVPAVQLPVKAMSPFPTIHPLPEPNIMPAAQYTPVMSMPPLKQQPPYSRFDADIIQIPEVRPQYYQSRSTPANGELNFQMPAFGSPAFQASIQSTCLQSRGATPSPNQVYPSGFPQMMPAYQMPLICTPSECMGIMTPFQFHSEPAAAPRQQNKASDFTLFTNKYMAQE